MNGLEAFRLVAKLMLDKSEYEKGMTGAESEAKSSGSKIGAALGNVGSVVGKGLGAMGTALKNLTVMAGKAAIAGVAASSAAIGKMVVDSTKAYASFEQLSGGIQKLYGNMGMSLEDYAKDQGKTVDEVRDQWQTLEDAQNKVMENANNAWLTVGMDANTYMESITGFSAALLNATGDSVEAAKAADEAMKDIADNANTFGKYSAEELTQVYQALAKGQYQTLDNLNLGFGGTKEGMQSLIDKANELAEANGEAADLTIDNYADIVHAIHLVQQDMNIAGTTEREAMKTIEGSVNATKAAWENLKLAVGKGEGISDAIKNISTALFGLEDDTEHETGLLNQIVPRVQSVMEGVGEMVAQAAPIIADKLPVLFDTLLPSLLNATKSLVQSLAASLPSILQIFVKYLPQIIDMVVDGVLSIVPVLVGMIPQVLPTLLNGLLQIIQGLVAALPQLINSIIGVLPSLMMQIIQAIIALAPELIQASMSMIMALAQGLIEALPELIPAITEMITQIVIMLTQPDMLVTLVMASIQIMIAIAQGLIQAIPILIQAIPVILANLIVALSELFTELANTILPWLGELFGNMISSVSEWLGNLVNTVQEWFAQLPTTMAYWVGFAIGSVLAFFMNLPANIALFLTEVINKVVTFGTQMRTKATDAGRSFFNGIIDNIKNLPARLSQLAESLISAVASLPSRFAEVGKNIIDGLWNGISSGWSWLTGKVSELAQSLLQGAKDALGVASPSKKFMWVGEMIDLGLAKGIDNFSYLVDGAIGDLTGNMLSITPQLAYAGAATGSGYNQTVNIYSPTPLTPSEVARQTRNATRDMVLGLRGIR